METLTVKQFCDGSNRNKAKAIIIVSRNRFKQENEPIMQMWTSALAMSEFTSSHHLGDTEN